jgi:putative PIN family toxin of toxin-antitoxin system
MRVVLDTNIAVSAYITPGGNAFQILSYWDQHIFELVISEPILEEYQRALKYDRTRRYHQLTDQQISQIIEDFRSLATMTAPKHKLDVIKDDSADNMFLECALAGQAELIVSGDKHLKDLGEYQGIRILSAAEFLAFLKEQTNKAA